MPRKYISASERKGLYKITLDKALRRLCARIESLYFDPFRHGVPKDDMVPAEVFYKKHRVYAQILILEEFKKGEQRGLYSWGWIVINNKDNEYQIGDILPGNAKGPQRPRPRGNIMKDTYPLAATGLFV